MAFMTLPQLRNMSWPTREKALADLKRSGVKERGADYELREYKPGSWQLMELGEDGEQLPFDDPPPKAKAKAKAEHPSETAARTAISEATGFSIHFRVSPKKSLSETAGTLQDARETANRLNAEHGKSGRRAMIYATFSDKRAPVPVPADYMPSVGAEAPAMKAAGPASAAQSASPPKKAEAKKAAAKQPATKKAAAAPTPTEDQNDMTPLPAADGPYGLRVGEAIAQHDLLSIAVSWSRSIGFLVEVTDKAGKTVRVIDGRKGGRRPTRTAVRTEGRTPREPGTGKAARAIALLKRPGGATAAELNKATDWPIAQRHINRMAKISGLKIKQLGEKKWQLT
jgi:hypothetical protein